MHIHQSLYNITDTVYIKNDPEQRARLVTDIQFSFGGQVLYFLAFCTEITKHYEFELSIEPNELLKLS